MAFVSQPLLAFLSLVLSGILAIISCVWVYIALQAHQEARRIPYVPPVTAKALPAEEVLVRGSEEPAQEQGKVLLRGTEGSTDTGEQELLRSSQGQE